MKVLVCEICGNQGLNKSGDRFVCPSCGTGYPVEEAKKLLQEVDTPAEAVEVKPVEVPQVAEPAPTAGQLLEKYLGLARTAADSGNYKEASKYYILAKEQDANDWEAFFYSNFYTAAGCTVAQIGSSSVMVVRTGTLALELLKDLEPGHRLTAVQMMLESVSKLSEMMYQASSQYTHEHDSIAMYEKMVVAVLNAFPEERNIRFICADHCGALLESPYNHYTSGKHSDLLLEVYATFRKEEAAPMIRQKIANYKKANLELQGTRPEADVGALLKFLVPGILFDLISFGFLYYQAEEGFDNLVVLVCAFLILLIGLIFTIVGFHMIPKPYTPEQLQRHQRVIAENNQHIQKLEQLLK